MNNLRQDFDIERNKTRIMLNNVASMEIDISFLSQELESILISDNSYSNGFQKQLDYRKKMNDLKSFQRKLKEYETLFKINNSTVYLCEFIKKEMNAQSVRKCSEEVIVSLNELRKCTFSSDKMDEVKSLLLDTVYNVIKLEFVYVGSSKTLDYIIKNKTFILDINNRILGEVEKLKNSINSVDGLEGLKSVLFERNKMGVCAHYVSDETFKYLVLCTEVDKINAHMNKLLDDFLLKITEVKDGFIKLDEDKLVIDDKICSQKSFRRSSFKDLRTSIIASLLAGSVLGGIVFALRGPIKGVATSKKYMTTTSSITLEEGRVEEGVPEYQIEVKEGYRVQLEVSNKYDNKKIKKLVYDVTEQFPQGQEYTFDDFSFLDDITPISSETTKKAKGLTEEEIEAIKEIYKFIVTTQDLEDEDVSFNAVGYYILLGMTGGIAFGLFVFISWLFDGEKIPDNLRSYLQYNKNVIEYSQELRKIIEESCQLINTNSRLKEEFIEFYETNKHIIDLHFASVSEDISNTLKNNEDAVMRFMKK